MEEKFKFEDSLKHLPQEERDRRLREKEEELRHQLVQHQIDIRVFSFLHNFTHTKIFYMLQK
jgi:hypothetical protein